MMYWITLPYTEYSFLMKSHKNIKACNFYITGFNLVYLGYLFNYFGVSKFKSVGYPKGNLVGIKIIHPFIAQAQVNKTVSIPYTRRP